MKNSSVEILDFEDEVVNTNKSVGKKKKILINDELEEINNIANESSTKDNKKRKYGKGEKIFVILSILFIIGCFVFYGYRTYYYYHATHDIVKNVTLKDKLTALNNIAYQNDGLYEKSGYFYYKGIDVNNYVYYSGRMFRIIDISNGIRMIEDETETNLVWGMDTKYSESYINNWLKAYLNTLKDYDVYLDKNKWCNEVVEIENYKCTDNIEEYVGLISTSDYLQAGGKNSYLNNGTYFWTINQDYDGNVFYVNNEGSINNVYKRDDNYFSYGIRPVITLKDDIGIVSGDGSKDNPYVIEDLGNALLKDNSVGNYVKYSDDIYRVLSIDEKGIELIYDGMIEVEKKYGDVYKYLNNEFIKKFNEENLVKNDYYIDEYSYNNKYIIENKNKKSNYIIIPSIGTLFLNKDSNYWLNDYSNKDLGLYYILDENKMLFADLSSNKHYIKPIIKVNIEMVVSSGKGTINDPLVIGKEDDNNVEKD